MNNYCQGYYFDWICLLFLDSSVAAGVAAFKAGEGKKALKMLDHALSIDPQNVEGLVARGAL